MIDTTTFEAATQRALISASQREARLEMALETVRIKLQVYALPAFKNNDWRKREVLAAIEEIDAVLAAPSDLGCGRVG